MHYNKKTQLNVLLYNIHALYYLHKQILLTLKNANFYMGPYIIAIVSLTLTFITLK